MQRQDMEMEPVVFTRQWQRLGLVCCCLTMLLMFQLPAQAQGDPSEGAEGMELANNGDAEQVNINQADASRLAQVLDGIGRSRAEAIVKYREQHGRFQTLQDLMAVSGVGEMTVMRNERRIVFD